ncbi:hypothetical protein [Photobacterium leiognathi]|uniref:hypothetical protein n=1 Tax=Photobacterium leiognathi TaxID=553611 RepID=UPI0011B1F6E9|nr:hypothetical protein [Photobacterium leiognathi]
MREKADSFYCLIIDFNTNNKEERNKQLRNVEKALKNKLNDLYIVKKPKKEVFIVNGHVDPLFKTKEALADYLDISVERLEQYLKLVSFKGTSDKVERPFPLSQDVTQDHKLPDDE